ncbi:MAG: isochorismatase family protein, partial [Clostridia bacterium]|nr:isochorismatase family protein [Clostridia bacterium]
DTPEGKKLPVPHCIKGTKGWEIADGLYVEGSKVIDKPNFGWPNWNEEDLEEVELIGLCTDICVVSNALIIKAAFSNAVVKVDKACCAGVTPESHEAALITMKMCQIDVN